MDASRARKRDAAPLAPEERRLTPVPAPAPGPARDRRIALAVLAAMSLAFVGYNLVFVPRLGNNHFGDIEFTGWGPPVASRLLAGERPYIDFVLPIPPGSFALLALVQAAAGKSLLLHELWLVTGLHLAMALLAYAIVAPLTTRVNVLLVTACTLVTVIQLNKELSYDHTAQTLVWLSFLTGVRALFEPSKERGSRLWLLTGLLSAFTLAFKQSTGVGILGGWLVAFGYLASVELLGKQRSRARIWARPVGSWLAGAAGGVVLVWLVLVGLGSTLPAYFQAVFTDASELKGGSRLMVRHLVHYLYAANAFPSSLAFVTGLLLVGLRIVRTQGGLHVGDEPARREPLPLREAVAIAAAVGLTFTAAAIFILTGPFGYRLEWVFDVDRLKQVPYLSFAFLTAFFIAHLVKVGPARADGPPAADARRTGHVLNALVLAAFFCSLLHNTSAPEFRPFYDNNPIIPFGFMMVFVGLDRARLRWLKYAFLALMLASLFGNRVYRAMTARVSMGSEGHWAGMWVSDRGATMARIAERIRELTEPEDTVLVLPEDLQLSTLIGRPRPPLRGAIVFVDQYAPRLTMDDIRRLDAEPPRVIVLHPREPRHWQRFFRIWSGDSGAERVLQHVLDDLLPSQYELDETHDTMFLWEPATLEIYVRRGPEPGSVPED